MCWLVPTLCAKWPVSVLSDFYFQPVTYHVATMFIKLEQSKALREMLMGR